MRTAPIARGFFLGDYEGLAHVDQASLPFFVITNSGNLTNRTDVFAAVPRAGEDVPGEQGSNVQEQVNTAARSSQALAAQDLYNLLHFGVARRWQQHDYH